MLVMKSSTMNKESCRTTMIGSTNFKGYDSKKPI